MGGTRGGGCERCIDEKACEGGEKGHHTPLWKIDCKGVEAEGSREASAGVKGTSCSAPRRLKEGRARYGRKESRYKRGIGNTAPQRCRPRVWALGWPYCLSQVLGGGGDPDNIQVGEKSGGNEVKPPGAIGQGGRIA